MIYWYGESNDYTDWFLLLDCLPMVDVRSYAPTGAEYVSIFCIMCPLVMNCLSCNTRVEGKACKYPWTGRVSAAECWTVHIYHAISGRCPNAADRHGSFGIQQLLADRGRRLVVPRSRREMALELKAVEAGLRAGLNAV
eukprot:scaffold222262_cov40-Prasinocladus_malaysianus.AAC.1